MHTNSKFQTELVIKSYILRNMDINYLLRNYLSNSVTQHNSRRAADLRWPGYGPSSLSRSSDRPYCVCEVLESPGKWKSSTQDRHTDDFGLLAHVAGLSGGE